MSAAAAVRTYAEFSATRTITGLLRDAARSAAVAALSIGRSIGKSSGWVRFPYYHHVFDDERAGFERQLRYLGRFGEFIGLDDAVGLLREREPLDGRFFCLTFDDGFKNNAVNALPILGALGVPAAFFLATGYIGLDIRRDREKLLGFYRAGRILMEFMGWDDVRRLANAGMTIGSHTAGHARLSDLRAEQVDAELTSSKSRIEAELGKPCRHFCAPFGRKTADFDPAAHPPAAARAGYESFLTTERGPNRPGNSVMAIRRDHMLANWGNHQLRYFFSRE